MRRESCARAERALAAWLRAGGHETGDRDYECNITDLLTDLRWLALRDGLDWEGMDYYAEVNLEFDEENAMPPRAAKPGAKVVKLFAPNPIREPAGAHSPLDED